MELADEDFIPKICNQSPIKRKYLAEAGLHLFTGGPAMFRPSDMYRFADSPHFRNALEGTNIYLICRRRRISVCPNSIEIKGDVLSGEFIVHGDSYFEWQDEKFTIDKSLLEAEKRQHQLVAARSVDSFGHAVEVVDNLGRRNFIPSSVLVALSKHKLSDRTKLEVLYVGQTFGKNGERISLDRLKGHTTLQKIQADCADESGSDEVLILAFQYGSTKNWMSTAGDRWVEPTATQEEESAYMKAVGQKTFDRKTRILLAEAALINHFKPRYNELHRESFRPKNNRKLKTLQKLFEADMSALIVEVNTSNIGAKLWSKNVQKSSMDTYFTPERIASMRNSALSGNSQLTYTEIDNWLKDQSHAHIARFPLFDKSQRETFLHALPWQTK